MYMLIVDLYALSISGNFNYLCDTHFCI